MKLSNVKVRKNTNYTNFFYKKPIEAAKHLYQRQRNKIKTTLGDSFNKYYETNSKKKFSSSSTVLSQQ